MRTCRLSTLRLERSSVASQNWALALNGLSFLVIAAVAPSPASRARNRSGSARGGLDSIRGGRLTCGGDRNPLKVFAAHLVGPESRAPLLRALPSGGPCRTQVAPGSTTRTGETKARQQHSVATGRATEHESHKETRLLRTGGSPDSALSRRLRWLFVHAKLDDTGEHSPRSSLRRARRARWMESGPRTPASRRI